ncbi:MAG: hypothetical protein HWN79_03115 [Candidatus Lokiarchaeota archaeon]|nr:hypothetical protein [Candidatus Lokiarchaeota archaeon]
MTEITKKLKILCIINASIGLSLAFLYIAVPYYYLSLIEWPFFDPYYSWAFGGIFLILSSFLLRSIKQNHGEKLKSVLEITIAWEMLILILNIISLILIPTPIISILSTWILNIIFILLIILNFLFLKRN